MDNFDNLINSFSNIKINSFTNQNLNNYMDNTEDDINKLTNQLDNINNNDINYKFEDTNDEDEGDTCDVNMYDKNEDEDVYNINKVNPLFSKFISLEVANFYCKEYFDDEDFIHMTFELPNDLLDRIMSYGKLTITEYFDEYMNSLETNNDDVESIIYYNIYLNCIFVYDKLLEYYMPSWYSSDSPHDINDYSNFNAEWTFKCKCLLDDIKHVLNLGMNDISITYLCEYNKEVYNGLFIIITRLELIFNNFNSNLSVNEFVNTNNIDYRHHVIRMVNNLCIILLYLKFYYVDNHYYQEMNEITPKTDEMITTDND